MNLFILRHAQASQLSPKYPDDRKRPLTAVGERDMFRVAKGMRELDLRFDLILTSPFIRAQRTAEIVAEIFKIKKIQISHNLASAADPRKLIKELNDHFAPQKNILLVGHEPYLSKLISRLSTGDEKLLLHFRKAGLCKLSVDELRFGCCATLEWLHTPKQLAKLGQH